MVDAVFMIREHPIQNDRKMLVTTCLQRRRRLFDDPTYAREAIETLYRVQLVQPFFLYGFVIMPEHMHMLLKVPAPGSISRIMCTYKYGVSMNIAKGPIWQQRFHCKIINEHPETVLQYIHQNPVRAGLCGIAEEYPWSSASGKWDIVDLDCG